MRSRFNSEEIEPAEEGDALVLTHPYHATNLSSDPYREFIQENEDRLNAYFVQGNNFIDDEGCTKINYPRVDLPSGYTTGIYEGTVKERDTIAPGNVDEDDTAKLLLEQNRVFIGGEGFFNCVRRTYNDFERKKRELGVDTDIGVMSEVSFANAVGLDGSVMMYSLEDIIEDDLSIYNDECLDAEFKGGDVQVYTTDTT